MWILPLTLVFLPLVLFLVVGPVGKWETRFSAFSTFPSGRFSFLFLLLFFFVTNRRFPRDFHRVHCEWRFESGGAVGSRTGGSVAPGVRDRLSTARSEMPLPPFLSFHPRRLPGWCSVAFVASQVALPVDMTLDECFVPGSYSQEGEQFIDRRRGGDGGQ